MQLYTLESFTHKNSRVHCLKIIKRDVGIYVSQFLVVDFFIMKLVVYISTPLIHITTDFCYKTHIQTLYYMINLSTLARCNL